MIAFLQELLLYTLLMERFRQPLILLLELYLPDRVEPHLRQEAPTLRALRGAINWLLDTPRAAAATRRRRK